MLVFRGFCILLYKYEVGKFTKQLNGDIITGK